MFETEGKKLDLGLTCESCDVFSFSAEISDLWRRRDQKYFGMTGSRPSQLYSSRIRYHASLSLIFPSQCQSFEDTVTKRSDSTNLEYSY